MKTILIVEDNPQSAYMLNYLLTSNGYETFKAENGKLGLEIARKEHPDLIISDIMMPVMNGYKLCFEVKSDLHINHIPFIFYTATFTEIEDEKLAMSLGASEFVIKPASDTEILNLVRKYVSKPKSETITNLESTDCARILDLLDSSLNRKIVETVEKLRKERDRLEESEFHLKSAQEVAKIGHWKFNFQDKSLYWSDQIYRILGMVPQSVQPTFEQVYERIEESERKRVISGFEAFFKQKMTYDTMFKLNVGSTAKHIHSCSEFVLDDSGTIVAAIGTFQDVTEKIKANDDKRKLERQLQQTQKMEAIGTLAGGIAHDFNNILSPILCYAEMLSEKLEKDPLLQEYVSQMIKAVDRGTELVEMILSFSRKNEPELKVINLSLVVHEAIKLLRASIPTTIEFEENILVSEINTVADSTQIHQIVMNLGVNSYHAMKDRGGTLRVELEQRSFKKGINKENKLDGDYAVLSISDTGHGISKADIERVFDPYYTTKPKGEGTGLGLAIVRGIMKSYKGEVTISS
jgi:signal transduction histidine kinase/CheY-like chemotaxis protein